MSDAWGRVLDHTTPYSALDGIADRLATAAVDDLREQLNGNDELTYAERVAILRTAWPKIHAGTRAALESGWIACKLDVMTATH